jgi:hypothetical protein
MQPEARAILDVFHSRGLRTGSFVSFADFGAAIPWKDGFIRDKPVRDAFVMLIKDGYVVEMLEGLELTARGEEQLYGSAAKHGARVYRVGARILVEQRALRGTPPEYVIDEHRERHVDPNDDRALARAIRDALEGRL